MARVGYIFPEFYGGEYIGARQPYAMPGELIVANGGVNISFGNVFLHAADQPFEVHAVKARGAQSPQASPFTPVADPAPSLDQFWRLRIKSLSLSTDLMQAPTLVDSLVDHETKQWDFGYPMYVENGTGFQAFIDNLLAAPFVLRGAVTFLGYLITTKPAYSPERGG